MLTCLFSVHVIVNETSQVGTFLL